jgi:uroporphyrinogen decarboxylase
MMNSRERFMTALRGGVPDRVPLFEFYWGPPFIKAVLGDQQASPYHNADDEVAMSRATGIDMVYTAPYGLTAFTSIQSHGEEFEDEWGTRWGSNQDSWPGAWPKREVVKNREDWKNLRIPDPTLPMRMDQPRRTVELAGAELAVLGGVRGPFSALWMLAGLINISMWVYDDPQFLDELLREMGRWNTQLGLELIRTGVDAVIIHDDWGMNESTFISPNDWKRFVLPYIAEEVETLANTGTPVILHSDGNLNALMDEIVQLRISALNPLQRSARMDLAETKAKYGDRLCLIGNISTTTTLAYGTPDDVEREVLECLRDAAPGGGYIVAPDHSFHSAIPFENIWRVLNICKEYATYPLDTQVIQGRLNELSRSKVDASD